MLLRLCQYYESFFDKLCLIITRRLLRIYTGGMSDCLRPQPRPPPNGDKSPPAHPIELNAPALSFTSHSFLLTPRKAVRLCRRGLGPTSILIQLSTYFQLSTDSPKEPHRPPTSTPIRPLSSPPHPIESRSRLALITYLPTYLPTHPPPRAPLRPAARWETPFPTSTRSA